MDNIEYAEELVREFIVFRGFTHTLQAFETELSTDVGKGFQVDKVMDLIFKVYVPKFQAEKLVSLLGFLKQCFSSSSEGVLITTLSRLELSVLRYYIVHALQSGRQDKVVDFFGTHGNDLLQRSEDWTPWFGVMYAAIPYLKKPGLDPRFRVFFSKEWFDALVLSFRNFLSQMFNALLKISTEKNTVKRLKKDIKQLNLKLSQLQALLESKEAQLSQLRSIAGSTSEASMLHKDSFTYDQLTMNLSANVPDDNNFPLRDVPETSASVSTSFLGEIDFGVQDQDFPGSSRHSPEQALSESEHDSCSQAKLPLVDNQARDSLPMFQEDLCTGTSNKVQREEEFPEVKVAFQETFLGHTSPISRCRFSAAGTNIASASVDGTVRIWTYDSSTPTSRNATIYCGAEILSLDWESKSDRLLLIGTADAGIKAWNVDAKRVVCDLSTTAAFPSVLDLKCSPVEPIFVYAAASRGLGSGNIDKLGFASLTVWNMKVWKAMTVLPLGKDPPAITSLCFNHNGKILAASAVDGMIHMFDMSAGLQITGWPAHDSAVSSVLFGPDETSIFSLGSDGKAIPEWLKLCLTTDNILIRGCRFLNGAYKIRAKSFGQEIAAVNQLGRKAMIRNTQRLRLHPEKMSSANGCQFFSPGSTQDNRHEMALDSYGRRLLVTSSSVRSPIYQVQGHMSALRTLPHSAAIRTVDWHPSLPIFLTGSADHSVRVTSLS
ncbi:WD repeat-containing protein 91 [Cinnamomum micranthum f. kanehirae]|uniref:WD repeat-containing protein 91 n=1 Tax=Cinnamomum micranthum f. kanehirae TaxID=337451 RepID=A0A443Q0K0_9MAGN|nr:WD repeat-containing protein 91 [Cinnamomum micranthum f. kanehirae]